MKTIEQAWRAYGVDDDMPPHDLFIAGWDAALEGRSPPRFDGAGHECLSLAAGAAESRDRNLNTAMSENDRLQREVDRLAREVESLNLAEEGAKEAFGVVVDSKRALEKKSNGQQQQIQSLNHLVRKVCLQRNEMLALLVKVDSCGMLAHGGDIQAEVRAAIAIAKATFG